MKRTLGVMVSNWLRKPENQQKVKRATRQLWNKYQQRKASHNAQPKPPSADRNPHRRNTESQRPTDRR